MASAKDIKAARDAWNKLADRIRTLTDDAPVLEEAAEKSARIERLLSNYAAFCEYYFPHFLNLRDKVTGEVIKVVHNAPFHNEAAENVKNTPNLKAVFKWPRGHAKSTHFDVFLPLWLMFQKKRLLNVMVIVSKSEDAAKTLLGDIQAELEYNQRLIADFGPQKSEGDWEESNFVTLEGVAFFARGRGQSPRGLRYKENRPDYIIIDDLDDDELCRNEKRVNEMADWVKEALFGCLDVGRGRFIMIGNLISKNSVLQKIIDTRGVWTSEVKAVDEDGAPVWADKWTRDEVNEVRQFMGYRAFEKEMMHNPITSGGIFRNDWIQWRKALPLEQYDELVCYTDPSFKASKGNDYKACRLWGKKGTQLHLIDCFVRQDTVSHMVRWLYDLYEDTREIAPIRFYIEANFLQDIILDEFATEGQIRGYQLPISADRRKKPDKLQRIEAISPLWERGCIYYNVDKKDSPDMIAGIEQTLALEKGSRAHDDAPDADEGAIYILQQTTRRQAWAPVLGARPACKNVW